MKAIILTYILELIATVGFAIYAYEYQYDFWFSFFILFVIGSAFYCIRETLKGNR